MKIIVGVDGSPSSARAVEWCAAHATALEAEVVAVYSIEMPLYAGYPFGYVSLVVPEEPDRVELRDGIEREWCAPLSKANVPSCCQTVRRRRPSSRSRRRRPPIWS